MKAMYRVLFALHAFVGIGGIAGGLSAILNPQEPLGLSVEILKNSPFKSFLIPGILLFGVIGFGNLISALAILFKSKHQEYISSVFGWALVIWIIVQCIMLWSIHILHIIFFIIGVIEAMLSTAILFNQNLFPANIIKDYYKKFNKAM